MKLYCCDVNNVKQSQSLLSQKKGLFKNKVISLLLVSYYGNGFSFSCLDHNHQPTNASNEQ